MPNLGDKSINVDTFDPGVCPEVGSGVGLTSACPKDGSRDTFDPASAWVPVGDGTESVAGVTATLASGESP